MYQEVEAKDEMVVLSQLSKKERKTEFAGSCSIHDGFDGGGWGEGGRYPQRIQYEDHFLELLGHWCADDSVPAVSYV